MKYILVGLAMFALSACDGTFGVGVNVPIGPNASIGISTNSDGETSGSISASTTINP